MRIADSFPTFASAEGDPIDNGKIYIGVKNMNPETNPVAVYWDLNMTQLAAQPLRTMGGYIVRNGSAANVYTANSYSITVRTAMDLLIYSIPDSNAFTSASQVAAIDTIAELRELTFDLYAKASVGGYYVMGDGGGGNYYYDPSDNTSNDNGGTIIVANDGARWKLTNIKSICFEQFGAKGDGVTDDTEAIQSCIDAVGGIYPIYTPMDRNYIISATIMIGDGSASAPSTVHGIAIIGTGAGITTSEFGGGYSNTKFTWTGSSSGIMMRVNGPVFGVNLEGFTLDCAGLAATGIQSLHICDSLWQNILVENYIGVGYQWLAYGTPTGCVVGASGSTFINTSAKKPGANGLGADFGQSTGNVGNLNVARNTWINCEFWRDHTSIISYSMKFQFIDNCTFIECTASPVGGLGVSVYVLPPTGTSVTGFPAALTFINCPILGPASAFHASWAANEGFQFWPYPVGDGEIVPDYTPIFGQCYGVTTKNEYFGGIKIGVGNTAIKSHISFTHDLAFTAIDAHSSQDQPVAVSGVDIGDTVVVSAYSPYDTGLMLLAFVAASGSPGVPGTIYVRWSNPTATTKTPFAGATVTYRIDVWKH